MRALGAAGVKGCVHGCLYCFTQASSFVRPPKFDEIRVRDLKNSLRDYDYIQPSIDTELLLLDDWRKFIDDMVSIGKPISFATKSSITEEQLTYLININNVLKSKGNFLNVGVTIVKLNGWELIEPKAPSPTERINTLKKLKEAGISTTVLVRPLIPTLSYDEIEEIVKLTSEICDGYLAGPLYINDKMKAYFEEQACEIHTEMLEVDWQEGSPLLEAVVSEEKEKYLAEIAKKYGKYLFNGNTESMSFLRNRGMSANLNDFNNISDLRTENVVTVYMIDKSTKEILLLHDRYHGGWIPIGGQIQECEDESQAIQRIFEEKLICDAQIEINCNMKLLETKDIQKFKFEPATGDTKAFCIVHEIVNSVQMPDMHIHLSKVFIVLLDKQPTLTIKDRDKIMSAEWFNLDNINDIENTFVNVAFICGEISKLLA